MSSLQGLLATIGGKCSKKHHRNLKEYNGLLWDFCKNLKSLFFRFTRLG